MVRFINDFKTIKIRDGRFDCEKISIYESKGVVCRFVYGSTFFYDTSSKRLYSAINPFTDINADKPVLYAGTCEKF